MEYSYLGYAEDKEIVRGAISAPSMQIAEQILARSGCRVISLKPATTFMPEWYKLLPFLFRVKPGEIISLSRQLALLTESGVDIVTSLELLQGQTTNRVLTRTLGEIVSDLRSGKQLSTALDKHPRVFPTIYRRSLSVGEQTGHLETVLRQVADYMEKEAVAAKGIKNALRYPAIVFIVAVVVVVVIATFVLPAFGQLYTSLGVELPATTKLLLTGVSWFTSYGLYLIAAIVSVFILIILLSRTPKGKLQLDRLALRLPLSGRVSQTSELARCCRSMSLLLQAGLPLPEIMSLVVEGCDNMVIREALAEVRQDMLKGEGLYRPMTKSPLFLPLMVQMIRVGEETGELDTTLLTVAQTYEDEAQDRMSSLIGLIQPTMTIVIALFVTFLALSLVSAMYSIFGETL